MKHYCVIIVIALLTLSCNNSRTTNTSPSQLIPEQFDVVIKINAFESLENGIKNNNLIQELSAYKQLGLLNHQLKSLKNLNLTNSLISISEGKNDSLDLCLILPLRNRSSISFENTQLNLDSIFSSSNAVKALDLNNNSFHGKIIDSILFISNNKELTTNAGPIEIDRPDIEAFMRLSDDEKMISVLSRNDLFNSSLFTEEALGNTNFSEYSIYDAEISQNTILLNGITRSKDSTSAINIFKNVIPQKNNIASAIPEGSSLFKSYTFDDFDILRTNLNNHSIVDSLSNCSGVFRTINEIAEVALDNQTSLVLQSIDPVATKDLLETNQLTSEYRGIAIYTVDYATLSKCLYPVINLEELNHFTILDDFFIFTKEPSTLEGYISNYLNNTVLGNTEQYKNLMKDMSDESSLLIYMNSQALNAYINSLNTDDINLDIPEYKSSAIQYVYDSDFAHVNSALTTHKSSRIKNSVSEELDIKLDNELMISPQLVRNHRSGQMDILTQDINNNLYLISNTGKVFWKKQLDGKIMGQVHQIDTYKNGRLQLVFNTSKRLYVLDRNGKDVNAFPLKFNDNITQPVSVFDYDKKKNYRLMITQGKSVLMYDKNGKIVSGFTYKSANNTIASQPKHFRIGRKDYIVFSEGNRLEILDRVGKTRIDVRDNISFSNNDVYLYQNKFTTSSTNGELIQIDSKGHKSSRNLQANSDHKIATTSKTLVVLNDNKLTIKSNSIDLDFGVYTSPKIFYINDKIYVTVTDLQSKKGYLFDSQAKPIANFPVFANSTLELGNIDKDKALEVITKGDDNAIIVYELN